mmetsp:Transcript_80004/g.221203  ORF Transcript_80004/g.221203 Transcript_80004/m.221203 type:complete len:213 (-) Transcript_80004:2597-3235(-)
MEAGHLSGILATLVDCLWVLLVTALGFPRCKLGGRWATRGLRRRPLRGPRRLQGCPGGRRCCWGWRPGYEDCCRRVRGLARRPACCHGRADCCRRLRHRPARAADGGGRARRPAGGPPWRLGRPGLASCKRRSLWGITPVASNERGRLRSRLPAGNGSGRLWGNGLGAAPRLLPCKGSRGAWRRRPSRQSSRCARCKLTRCWWVRHGIKGSG